MPKRKRKKYSRPRKPFDKIRILEENELVKRYGLKNKKEIWKADAAISRIRNLAKQLITKSDEEKKLFIERLQKKGFPVQSIAEALALNKEDWLKRRLQTIVYAKKLTSTPKQARQFVVHRHVFVGDSIVNKPSYQVSLEKEPLVKSNIVLKQKPKEKSKIQEIKEDIREKAEMKKEIVKKDIKEKPIIIEKKEKSIEEKNESGEEKNA